MLGWSGCCGHSAGLAAERLQRVRRFIEDHLDGDLSLARLAAVAYLSPYHFARRFKVSTGMTPHQYVVSRRVERAHALLLAGEDGIAHVATRVGFSSQSHLTFHMRRVLGVSPGELLRRSRRSTERLLSGERCWQQ
ncbi:MAG: AraC family transcriptional regulator [Thermodesulfobacteriota bacterium]|jgi:AraC family transcriptional regulator